MFERKWLFGLGAILLVALSSFGTFVAMSGPQAPPAKPYEAAIVVTETPETVSRAISFDFGEFADIESLGSFEATAYSNFGVTSSGVLVNRGIVAADPRYIPEGSVIAIEAGPYSGIYTVLDVGGVIKGRIIDIYMPDTDEAIQFGRQEVRVHVLRKGWHPDQVPTFQQFVAG